MATKSKAAADPNAGKNRYIALRRMSNHDGSEVWQPGSEIWLEDAKAALHLAKGTITTDDKTAAPIVEDATVIHEAKEITNGDTSSTATD